MMEFYNEKRVIARSPHVCEMCGGAINPGDAYYRETGKYRGDFFSRALHVSCHFMETEYCSEVEPEFDWWAVRDFIAEKFCDKCGSKEDDTCEYASVCECPKIKEQFTPKEAATNEHSS